MDARKRRLINDCTLVTSKPKPLWKEDYRMQICRIIDNLRQVCLLHATYSKHWPFPCFMICLSTQALCSLVCNGFIWQACFVRHMWFDTMSLGLVRFSGNDRLVPRNCLSIDCRHNSACLFLTEARMPYEGAVNKLSVYPSKFTVQVFCSALLSCQWQNDSCPICN